MGIEHHPGVRPPEGRTNGDATTVGKWGISRGSAQNIWDRGDKRVSFQEPKGALISKGATHEA